MARYITLGWEINSTTTDMEFDDYVGSPTISSSVVRSGNYSGRIGSLASATRQYFGTNFKIAGFTKTWYRVYVNFTTLPTAENRIIAIKTFFGPTTPYVYLTIDNAGVLKLYDEDGQIAGTTTLSTSTWYCIEIKIDTSAAAGSHIVESRVDGAAAFATSSTRSISGNPGAIYLGGNLNAEAQTQGVWYFDDLAVNDDAGSAQNGYPGPGSIIIAFPTGAGSSNQWTTGAGRTAGSSSNYNQVDENPPDDGTTYIGSTTVNDVDMYTISPTPIGAGDAVTLATISCRWRNDVATASGLDVAIQHNTSGGTDVGTSYTLNSATWKTNASNGLSSLIPRFTKYTDFLGNPYTKASIDASQIGVKITTASSANYIEISSMWLTVEYVPSPATYTVKGFLF